MSNKETKKAAPKKQAPKKENAAKKKAPAAKPKEYKVISGYMHFHGRTYRAGDKLKADKFYKGEAAELVKKGFIAEA